MQYVGNHMQIRLQILYKSELDLQVLAILHFCLSYCCLFLLIIVMFHLTVITNQYFTTEYLTV